MVDPQILDGFRQMYEDRKEAGRVLAKALTEYKDANPIVLGLPRGGVVVGFEVAEALNCPLDVLIVRKIGAPGNPEFGIGAIAEENVTILDDRTINIMRISALELRESIAKELKELDRRLHLYRGKKAVPRMRNRIVIIIDDGLATGVTAQAAIESVKKLNPKKIIFAVPVCSYETSESLRPKVDSMICLYSPYDLSTIGLYYRNFNQVSDEEVIRLLTKNREKNQIRNKN